MAKRKMGRPKLPDDQRREVITLRLPKPFVKRFGDHVAAIRPRTTVTAVIEMLMTECLERAECEDR